MGYRRELVGAERLLALADYDYDLAAESLDMLFSDRRFNWRMRQSLLWLKNDFLITMAIAKADRAERQAQQARAEQAYQAAMTQENIFSK